MRIQTILNRVAKFNRSLTAPRGCRSLRTGPGLVVQECGRGENGLARIALGVPAGV